MKSLFSTGVTARLSLVFGALSLLVLINVGLLYWQQESASTTIDQLVENDLARMRLIDQWGGLARETTVRIMAVNKSNDAALGDLFNPEIGSRVKQVGQLFQRLQETAVSEVEINWFKAMEPKRQGLLKAIKDVDEYKKIGDVAGASAMFDTAFLPAVKDYLGEIDNLDRIETALLNEKIQTLHRNAQFRSLVVMALAMVFGALILLFAAGIIRHIKRSLRQSVRQARAVADGDLRGRMDAQGHDEFADLTASLNDMSGALQGIVVSVREGTDSIASASAEIALGNRDLSQRTEAQASEIQETTASVEQLSTMVNDNADRAQHAAGLAADARGTAERGGEIVSQVVSTMNGISTSSRKISEIIGVIDGIAFQTNILALNAAVEAARAGEQGRGFAVVASEVRSLAGRSAEAAREIKALIGDSASRVEQGAGLVDQAGQVMADVVQGIRQVSDLMTDIRNASQEQRTGVSQVGEVMRHIDHGTQQNAAMVEQVSAAAASLESQAQKLVQAVSAFRVEAGHGRTLGHSGPAGTGTGSFHPALSAD